MALQIFNPTSGTKIQPSMMLFNPYPANTLNITMGGWIKSNNVTSGYGASPFIINLGTSGFTQNRAIAFNSTANLEALVNDGTNSGGVTSTTAFSANDWVYFIVRTGSGAPGTLRLATLLMSLTGGAVDQVRDNINTTSPTSCAQMQIGFVDNVRDTFYAMAEAWVSSSFPSDPAADMSADLLRRFAFGGPLSIPQFVPDFYFPLRENWNFYTARQKLTRGTSYCFGDFAGGGSGSGPFAPSSASIQNMWVTHPPLPGDYTTINQTQRVAMF